MKQGREKHKIAGHCMLWSVLTLSLSACAAPLSQSTLATSSSLAQTAPSQTEPDKRSSTNVSQIGDQALSLQAPQISAQVDVNQLTVDQLRIYADRCSPKAKLPQPKDLDCSELGLRVKRVFRSNDNIAEALITLDRLGRNDTGVNALEDLEDGRPGASFSSQAIAGGLLGTDNLPPERVEPVDSLEEFLNQNGLSINAGAIIRNSN